MSAFWWYGFKVPAAGQTIVVDQATEVDLAQAVAVSPLRRLVGQVTELDTAQAVGRLKSVSTGQVTETDFAQIMSIPKIVGLVVETDQAFVVNWSPKHRLVSQVLDTEIAQTIRSIKTVQVNQAVELDTVFGMSVNPFRRLVGQALEADEAMPVSVILGGAAGAATDYGLLCVRTGH